MHHVADVKQVKHYTFRLFITVMYKERMVGILRLNFFEFMVNKYPRLTVLCKIIQSHRISRLVIFLLKIESFC